MNSFLSYPSLVWWHSPLRFSVSFFVFTANVTCSNKFLLPYACCTNRTFLSLLNMFLTHFDEEWLAGHDIFRVLPPPRALASPVLVYCLSWNVAKYPFWINEEHLFMHPVFLCRLTANENSILLWCFIWYKIREYQSKIWILFLKHFQFIRWIFNACKPTSTDGRAYLVALLFLVLIWVSKGNF